MFGHMQNESMKERHLNIPDVNGDVAFAESKQATPQHKAKMVLCARLMFVGWDCT